MRTRLLAGTALLALAASVATAPAAPIFSVTGPGLGPVARRRKPEAALP